MNRALILVYGTVTRYVSTHVVQVLFIYLAVLRIEPVPARLVLFR